MPCIICNKIPLVKLEELDKSIRVGDKTVEALSIEFEVDAEALAQHARVCIASKKDDDTVQLEKTTRDLADLSRILKEDIEDGSYKDFDPETGVDGKSVITNYIAVLREMRESIVARNRLRSSDDLVKGLTEVVVNPIISNAVRIYVEEIRRLRDALFTYTPESVHPRVKTAIDETLTRVGSRLKDEGIQDIKEKVSAVLTAKSS